MYCITYYILTSAGPQSAMTSILPHSPRHSTLLTTVQFGEGSSVAVAKGLTAGTRTRLCPNKQAQHPPVCRPAITVTHPQSGRR
jgi:hypothetical protein